MVLVTASCTMSWTSVHSSSGTLSTKSNSLNLFVIFMKNHKELILRSYLNGLVVFPTFFNFKPKFCNTELMIWATVSSRAYFCCLYRTAPSLAAKNIINLISVLTIWWCLCVESSRVVGRGCLLWPMCCLGKTLSLCPALFRTPRPNLPVTPDVSWVPPFAFQSPIMKRTSLLGVSSKRPFRSS